MYEASVICAVFDSNYEFEDIIPVGVAHTAEEANAMTMDDILRIMEDFSDGKCTVEENRSMYDEPIIIVHTNSEEAGVGHFHYYCLHTKVEQHKGE